MIEITSAKPLYKLFKIFHAVTLIEGEDQADDVANIVHNGILVILIKPYLEKTESSGSI